LIYGYVQQRRMVETRVETEKCQQQVDSLKRELENTRVAVERMNGQLAATLHQLQVERNAAISARNKNQ